MLSTMAKIMNDYDLKIISRYLPSIMCLHQTLDIISEVFPKTVFRSIYNFKIDNSKRMLCATIQRKRLKKTFENHGSVIHKDEIFYPHMSIEKRSVASLFAAHFKKTQEIRTKNDKNYHELSLKTPKFFKMAEKFNFW